MTTTNRRTPTQTALIALGTVLLIGGLICLVVGFGRFVTDDSGSQVGSSFTLFAGGGLAMVVGLGIVAFTRARVMMGDGAYTRMTFEQGVAPTGGRFCTSCGRPTGPAARFCDSCGSAVG